MAAVEHFEPRAEVWMSLVRRLSGRLKAEAIGESRTIDVKNGSFRVQPSGPTDMN